MANLNAVVQTIDQLCNTDCKHRNRWNTTQNYTCIAISTHIKTALDKQLALPATTVDKFYDYITRTNYYYDDACIKGNSSGFVPLIKNLFQNYPPSTANFTKFLMHFSCDVCYETIPQNVFDTDQYIDAIISSRLKYANLLGNQINDGTLVNTLLDKIQMTPKTLKKLLSCRSDSLAVRLAAIIDKTNIKLTEDMLNEACKVLPQSKPVIASLITRGLSLTSKHLLTACNSADANSLNYLINTGKITVAKEHFDEVIKSIRYYTVTDRYAMRKLKNYVRIRDNFYICTDEGYSPDKMEVLIKNGYNVTYDDVLFAIKHQKEIPGIERFNITLDKKLLEACWDVDFYPVNYKFDCISKNQIQLQQLCKTRKTSEIKSLLKSDSSLVIDRKCMENVCSFAKNTMYDYLLAKGGVPTIKCIENVGKMLKNNTLLLQVISDFEKANNKEIQSYKDKIAELEKKLASQNTQTSSNTQTAPLLNDSEKDQKTQKKVAVTKKVVSKKTVAKKKIVIVDDSEEADDNSQNSEEKTKTDEEKTSKTETKTEKEEKSKNDDSHPYVILPVDDAKITQIQTNFRNKNLPTEKMVKILKINSKEKISYSDVRNNLIVKIKDEGWIDKNNKNIINIPNDIKKILSLKDKTNIVQFSDIDKLVCLLY